MRVRARDDAGLTGSDPALRSFVWNYDPNTSFERGLVANGREYRDSVPVFMASINGAAGDYLPYTDGDTLPLVPSGVTIRAVVRAVDPDPPFRIDAVQARLVKDADFWTDLGPDRVFIDGHRRNFTGDYRLMARSLDGLDRWDGSPAVIRFSINMRARFIDTWEEESQPVTQRPVEGGVYPASRRDTLMVRFAAYDPDYSAGTNPMGLEFVSRWESYPLASGGQGSEVFFASAWMIGGSVASPSTTFRLPSGLSESHLPNPAGTNPAPVFLPGEYILVVRTRESFQLPEDRERFGYQVAERMVRFRLQ
jgi:hypothetical protein